MKYLQIIITSAILLVLAVGCNNGKTVTEEVIVPENTFCDLYLDLGYQTYLDKGIDPIRVYVVDDSSLYRYLDTVCLLLSEINPEKSTDYYYHIITEAREKEPPRRCLLVEQNIPYTVWFKINNLPGWESSVVKKVDGESVLRQELKTGTSLIELK